MRTVHTNELTILVPNFHSSSLFNHLPLQIGTTVHVDWALFAWPFQLWLWCHCYNCRQTISVTRSRDTWNFQPLQLVHHPLYLHPRTVASQLSEVWFWFGFWFCSLVEKLSQSIINGYLYKNYISSSLCDVILNYKMSAHLQNLFMDFPQFKVPNGASTRNAILRKIITVDIFSSVTCSC